MKDLGSVEALDDEALDAIDLEAMVTEAHRYIRDIRSKVQLQGERKYDESR